MAVYIYKGKKKHLAWDAEELRRLYQDDLKSINDIAAMFECSYHGVRMALKRFNIPRRSKASNKTRRGEQSPSWKGDNVSYSAFHYRLTALFGNKKECEVCGTTDPSRTYDWANLTGNYSDPKDYKRMCRSCHWKYDGKCYNLPHMKHRKAA